MTGASIDPEDPMRDYLIAQRREKKAQKKEKKSKGKEKHKGETPEERRARKARKKEKKAKSAMKGVEDLLNSLGRPLPGPPRSDDRDGRSGAYSSDRRRSISPRRRSRSRPPHRSSTGDHHRGASRDVDEGKGERESYGHHSRGKVYRD